MSVNDHIWDIRLLDHNYSIVIFTPLFPDYDDDAHRYHHGVQLLTCNYDLQYFHYPCLPSGLINYRGSLDDCMV